PLAAIALIDLPRARSRGPHETTRFHGVGWRAWPFVPGLALALGPQLLIEHTLFGTWLPYRPAAFAPSFWPGHYADVLVSTHNGLLTWSPVFALAALGLFLLPERRLALAGLFAFAVELVIEGSAPDWWGGLSFGMRRFLDLLPFVVVGLAELARRAQPWVVALGGSLLAMWNLVLVANFLYVMKGDRNLTYAELLGGQVEALRYVPRLFAQRGVGSRRGCWAAGGGGGGTCDDGSQGGASCARWWWGECCTSRFVQASGFCSWHWRLPACWSPCGRHGRGNPRPRYARHPDAARRPGAGAGAACSCRFPGGVRSSHLAGRSRHPPGGTRPPGRLSEQRLHGACQAAADALPTGGRPHRRAARSRRHAGGAES